MADEPVIRPATIADAGHLVDLVDLAGHGLPMATWASVAGTDGGTGAGTGVAAARSLGLTLARRDTGGSRGGFSWRNAHLAEVGGRVAGMAMVWRLPDTPRVLEGVPPLARPLQELENLCPGARYINAVAVYPRWRGRGIGRRLLDHAAAGGPACLITGDGNGAALALYAHAGFAEVARRGAIGDAHWTPPWREWVLMRRG